jgi:5-methyltetrahydrofolate--homocysteine methyltransferase
MGTMLQRSGLPLDGCPEAWNLERPETVRAVHAAYRDAGAELLQTNTFGGNRLRLHNAGLADQVAEVNAAAVRLAREVAAPIGLLIAGSMGPAGSSSLCPHSSAVLSDVFGEQAAALAAAGVDLFLIETMTSVAEARAAIGAAQSQSPLAVIVTLTLDRNGRTLEGGDPVEAAALLMEAGATAVGANCGYGPAELLPVTVRLRAAFPQLPLVVQPSAGLPRLVNGQAVYDLTPVEMATWACRLVAAGADFVGGCCGTTPEHIRAIRAVLPGDQSATG